MRDDFDNIRAERETAYRTAANTPSDQYVGLWKQIAIGIVAGHLLLGLIGSVVWIVAAQLLVGDFADRYALGGKVAEVIIFCASQETARIEKINRPLFENLPRSTEPHEV